MKDRWKMVFDRTLPMERRVFAALEAVFMPVSFVTLAGLVVVPVLGWCTDIAYLTALKPFCQTLTPDSIPIAACRIF